MSTQWSSAAEAPGGSGAQEPGGAAPEPTEEELRAAYEEELARVSSADMILQAAASLLNIGGLRLGLVPDVKVERDLEQVRDAIDGVRALLPILERRDVAQLRSLRDALSQLQMAYTRELQNEAPAPEAKAEGEPAVQKPHAEQKTHAEQKPGGPGPAESSGRLWVPGR